MPGRRGQKVKEALLAYALLLPAFLIIFTFGIFPLAFSAYQSTLRGLNKIGGTNDGLGNYVKAIDNLAYVLMFGIAAMFLFLAVRKIVTIVRLARSYQENPWSWTIAAIVTALGTTYTASVVIFETFNRDTRYGYASALAMILLVIIVILTVVNNRIAAERVFYG